jgi:hypothetical protein
VDTRQNPRRHVVFIKSSQMRTISTCLRRQGSPDYSLGRFISVCEFRQYWGHISKPNILQLQNVGRLSYLLSTFATVVKKHIYKNLPPQDKSWGEDVNKQTEFPLNQCTYCTHLAGFYTDDTSPWVLYSIHIQRPRRNLLYFTTSPPCVRAYKPCLVKGTPWTCRDYWISWTK